MLEILRNDDNIIIKNSDKKEISLNTTNFEVAIDKFNVSHAGEYEKSGILLEVKEYLGNLFYNFLVDSKHLVIITTDSFELKEEILSFFGDVDMLFIIGSKESAKVYENIEAKMVIPFGEGKELFLHTLSQHTEEVEDYKVKGEFPIDTTVFVNLK